jgi:hypothetical protein
MTTRWDVIWSVWDTEIGNVSVTVYDDGDIWFDTGSPMCVSVTDMSAFCDEVKKFVEARAEYKKSSH